MMVGKNLSDSQLQQIVDKTINYLDKDQDGKISFDEFQQLVDKKGALSDITSMLKVEGIWGHCFGLAAACQCPHRKRD